MALVKTPFLGGAYISRTRILNAQRCVNIYPELVETKDGKEVGGFYGCPGLDLQATVGIGPIRGLRTVDGTLYAVSSSTVYRVSSAWTATAIGTLKSSGGPVGMVDNGKQILFVDGTKAYGYDIDLDLFNDVVLPFASQATKVCAYQDGFFLLNESGTQSWWQSNLNEVFVWNGLNFSSADGQPDNIVAMVDHHREVWLLGANTTEVWINAGNPGFAFQRLQGVFLQQGCVAPYSAVSAGASVLWLGQDTHGNGVVYQSNGYQAQRISTHAIEREIQSYSTINDAIGYVYQQEGHMFYMLTFPAADKTWCYDISTGLWHERMWFDNGYAYRHRSNCFALFNNLLVVGDWENGNLYSFNLDTYTDAGHVRKWLRAWPALPTGQWTGRNVRYNDLQIYFEPGVSHSLPPGEDAKVMLRVSNDGGLSFVVDEWWRQIGKIGEVGWRAQWNPLGSARDRVYEVSGTDPCKVAMIAAVQDAEVGIS